YLIGIPLIIPILLGYYFQFLYSLPVNIEFYLKKTQYIAGGTVLSAGLNIILNWLLIPKFGYIAAGYTTVFSYMLLFFVHYHMGKSFFGKQLFDTKVITLITIFVITFSFFLYMFVDYFFLRYIVVIIISAIVFLI